MIRVIVGLGNPGEAYSRHRHNIGFRIVDAIAQRGAIDSWKQERNVLYCVLTDSMALDLKRSDPIFLVKPLTYMNLSGVGVRPFLKYRNLKASECLVICDDVALPFAKIRIRKKGSAGGQNGLKSVLECLGTKDVARLRFGIAPQNKSILAAQGMSNYVLSKFSKAEELALPLVMSQSVDAIFTMLTQSIDQAMNQFN